MRHYHMDFVRGALMTAGVAYHTGTITRTQGWTLKTEQTSEIYNWLTIFIHSFRMHIFFLLSGFFSAMLLIKMGRSQYLRNRLLRLVIPFVFVALTLQLFTDRGEAWDANYLLGGEWLGHLWFIGNLFIYMVVGAVALPVLKRFFVPIPYWLFLVGVSFLFMTATASTWYLPSLPFGSHLLFISPAPLLYFSVFFAAGMYLFLVPQLFESFHGRWANLIAATVGATMSFAYAESEATFRFFWFGMWAIGAGGLLMHASRTFIREDSKWASFLGRSSYSVYLLHQPILLFVGAYYLHLNPHLFFLTMTLGVAVACWWLHAFVIERSPVASLLLNGRPLQRGSLDIA